MTRRLFRPGSYAGRAGLFAAGALALALGCKKDAPPPPPPATPEQAVAALAQAGQKMAEASKKAGANPADPAAMAEAMKAMGAAMNGGRKVDPVSFHDLKALLPEEMAGLKRKEATGEKSGAMGLSVSEASARFEGEGGASLHVKIVDAGSVSGPLAMGLFGWASMEIDRETDDEYEKSTTLSGYKGFEKYNNKDKTGEVKVLVGGRFMVELRGHNVKIDDIKGALGKLDLKKLEGMKNEGVH